jgi:hypothetical protein
LRGTEQKAVLAAENISAYERKLTATEHYDEQQGRSSVRASPD